MGLYILYIHKNREKNFGMCVDPRPDAAGEKN